MVIIISLLAGFVNFLAICDFYICFFVCLLVGVFCVTWCTTLMNVSLVLVPSPPLNDKIYQFHIRKHYFVLVQEKLNWFIRKVMIL